MNELHRVEMTLMLARHTAFERQGELLGSHSSRRIICRAKSGWDVSFRPMGGSPSVPFHIRIYPGRFKYAKYTTLYCLKRASNLGSVL